MSFPRGRSAGAATRTDADSRVFWGCSMLGMGFVKNWSGLMAARWFLGLTEAGLFPGVNYYLSCWYKRSEFGVRAVSKRPPRGSGASGRAGRR